HLAHRRAHRSVHGRNGWTDLQHLVGSIRWLGGLVHAWSQLKGLARQVFVGRGPIVRPTTGAVPARLRPWRALAHSGLIKQISTPVIGRPASVAECREGRSPERSQAGRRHMCILCKQGRPQHHLFSRLKSLKGAAATGAAASALPLFAPRAAAADDGPPDGMGRPGRRIVIRNGAVMSMDPRVADFTRADVLAEGKKILAVGPDLHAATAAEIDARGRVVMPGFV